MTGAGFWSSVFSIAFVGLAARATVPYLLAAIGGSLGERSGVIDLALEAKLLVGAFCAAVAAHATGSVAVGILAGAAGGALVAAIHAALALVWRADQVVVGVALNLAAAGATRYLLEILYQQPSNSPPAPALTGGVWHDPIVVLAVIALIAVPLLVARTAFGLRLRAAGDRPDALRAAGVSVAWTRLAAICLGGVLAGLGGAELSLAEGGFSADMSGGRGYIALAAIILAGWRPARAAAVCVVFGLAHALSIQLQLHVAALPNELTQLFPYVLTLVVLAAAPLRTRPPAALGKPDL